MAARGLRFPDPSPAWLTATRDAYYRPKIRLEALVGRICRTDAGMAFHYRVRAHGRRSGKRA